MIKIRNRREFLIGSVGVLAVGVVGCDNRQKTQELSGVVSSAGSILAFAGVVSNPVGLAIGAVGGLLYLYSLVQDDRPGSEPEYKTYKTLTRRSDNLVPAGQVRIEDSNSRDVTSSVFIDSAAEPLLGGSLSNHMTQLRYRCPLRTGSLPYTYDHILLLKYRAKMLGIPTDVNPTPTGGGLFTIGYGGVDWQLREFADRGLAASWYEAIRFAPGFEVSPLA